MTNQAMQTEASVPISESLSASVSYSRETSETVVGMLEDILGRVRGHSPKAETAVLKPCEPSVLEGMRSNEGHLVRIQSMVAELSKLI